MESLFENYHVVICRIATIFSDSLVLILWQIKLCLVFVSNWDIAHIFGINNYVRVLEGIKLLVGKNIVARCGGGIVWPIGVFIGPYVI